MQLFIFFPYVTTNARTPLPIYIARIQWVRSG